MWKPHLLLIDDEVCSNRVLSQQLIQHGFDIEIINTASAAWAKLLADPHNYDLIILDRVLPDTNGIHFLERIRNVDKLKKLPVIIITAYATEQAATDAIKAGAVEFITKPVNIDLLLFTIGNILHEQYLTKPQKQTA